SARSVRLDGRDSSRPSVCDSHKPRPGFSCTMASRPLLYSMDISHYCVSAERMLAFKGVEFDKRYAPYHDRQEVIKATGQDYVPTLIWEAKPVMWYDIPDFL